MALAPLPSMSDTSSYKGYTFNTSTLGNEQIPLNEFEEVIFEYLPSNAIRLPVEESYIRWLNDYSYQFLANRRNLETNSLHFARRSPENFTIEDSGSLSFFRISTLPNTQLDIEIQASQKYISLTEALELQEITYQALKKE